MSRPPMLPPPAPADVALVRLEPFEPAPRDARIWLVRHGEVDATSGTRAYGASDVALSPRGLEQTRDLGAAFVAEAPARVLASPLERARLLGAAIAEAAGVPLELEDGLRELNRGTWQGLPRDEYRARWAADAEAYWRDPWHWRGHGGEADADVCARASAVFQRAAHAGGTSVLACHAQVIRVLLAQALGLPRAKSYALRMRTGHAALLESHPGRGWVLAQLNVPGPPAAV